MSLVEAVTCDAQRCDVTHSPLLLRDNPHLNSRVEFFTRSNSHSEAEQGFRCAAEILAGSIAEM